MFLSLAHFMPINWTLNPKKEVLEHHWQLYFCLPESREEMHVVDCDDEDLVRLSSCLCVPRHQWNFCLCSETCVALLVLY